MTHRTAHLGPDLRYTGQVKHSKFNGKGAICYKDGAKFIDGDFVDGQLTRGTKFYPDGTSWTGEFVDGVPKDSY